MLDLAALPIFPCDLDKEPLLDFRDDWSRWPLVGFPTGAVSGVDILDIDPEGRGWYDANLLPITRVHSTRRGLHLLFKHAEGLRCSNGMLAEGIDVRADGGFAIHWPATGRWFKDAPLSDWPHWLLAQALPLHSVSSWEVTLDGVPYQSGVAA